MEIPEGAVYAVIEGDGDEWEQQCGGYACDHKSIRGELIKLAGANKEDRLMEYFTGEKWKGWCCDGIDSDTAYFIEIEIPDFMVDRSRMSESCEAWIIGSVGAKRAVLAWGNSD